MTAELVESVRKNYAQGTTKSVKFRLQQLKNFQKFLEENEEDLVEVIKRDIRKHTEESRLEVIVGVNHVKFLISNLKSWTKPEKPSKRIIDLLDGLSVYHDPYGVVLVMGAWNVPLMTTLPAAGAIAAGNCVIIKPSHLSPQFGDYLAKNLPKYLDSRFYRVFSGDIEQTTNLLENRFDYIYYTGSTTVGKLIYKAATKHLTPVTLELGGKNPVYIDNTADLKMSARRIMWGKCFNSGHVCIAPDYILCTKEVEGEFLKHCKDALYSFGKESTNCPILNDDHFKRLKNLMQGLNIALGGHTDPLENLIEVTILTDVDQSHKIMQEEVFGPILPIVTIKNLDEAIQFINDREKALCLYVFSRDSKVKDRFIRDTSCGGITVNDVLMHLVVERLPFGGVGNSGMGRYKGKDSFETFSHRKGVLDRGFFGIIEYLQGVRYPPYSVSKSRFLRNLVKFRKGFPVFWLFHVVVFLVGIFVGYLIFGFGR